MLTITRPKSGDAHDLYTLRFIFSPEPMYFILDKNPDETMKLKFLLRIVFKDFLSSAISHQTTGSIIMGQVKFLNM